MLFNVVFILCLFVVISTVGATEPSSSSAPNVKPGQIVQVLTKYLRDYYADRNLNYDQDSYRLAVYVEPADNAGNYARIVPVIPKDAPKNIFPLHLRQSVSDSFTGQYPKIKGYQGISVLEGDFDLAVYHSVELRNIRTSEDPTAMSKTKLNVIKKKIEDNIKAKGMCPTPVAYPDLKGSNAESHDKNFFNIEPAQVVYFRYTTPTRGIKLFPAVVVCWTGQGHLMLMAIFNQIERSEKSEKITGSDFSLPFIMSGRSAKEQKPISGEVDLTHFHFRHYLSLTDPRPAPFLKEDLFHDLVDTIVHDKPSSARANAGESSSTSIQGNRPEPGPSSGGTMPGPSGGAGASTGGKGNGRGRWQGPKGGGKGKGGKGKGKA